MPGTDPALGGTPQYLGPAVIARAYHPDKPASPTGWFTPVTANGRPVRMRMENHLSPSPADTLPFPVDTTIMGAGMGPLDLSNAACDMGISVCASYTQNRASTHLHGGRTPWISDGTPHQWITPAGEGSPFLKGASFQNVPDMVNGSGTPCIGGVKCFTPSAGDGIATFYYSNEESPRLMFYHDHAYGITRLNVYDGMAAPYILVDQVEDDLIDGTNVSGVFTAAAITPTQILPNLGGVYRYGIPLVIQDKSFVNDAATDAKRSVTFPSANYVTTAHTLTTDPLWATYARDRRREPLDGPRVYADRECL